VLGELVKTTTGKWITHPPSDVPTGTPSARTKSSSDMSRASDTAAVDTPPGIAEPATPWSTVRRSTHTARRWTGQRQCGSQLGPSDGGCRPYTPRSSLAMSLRRNNLRSPARRRLPTTRNTGLTVSRVRPPRGYAVVDDSEIRGRMEAAGASCALRRPAPRVGSEHHFPLVDGALFSPDS